MAVRFTIDSEPVQEYRAALDHADTLAALRELLSEWEAYCWEALDTVKSWNEEDFVAFRQALYLERRGEYMGDESAARFQAVLFGGVALFDMGGAARTYNMPFIHVRERMIGVRAFRLVEGRYLREDQL